MWRKAGLFLSVLFLCISFTASVGAMNETEKINALIEYGGSLEGRFIRNGREHSISRGVKHINQKRKHYFRFRKEDADVFVEKVAFGSWKTGDPYIWRDTTGVEHRLQDVLRDRLEEIEKHG